MADGVLEKLRNAFQWVHDSDGAYIRRLVENARTEQDRKQVEVLSGIISTMKGYGPGRPR